MPCQRCGSSTQVGGRDCEILSVALANVQAEIEQLRDDRLRGLKIAYAITEDCQSVEEACAELVRIVRAQAVRAESAEAENERLREENDEARELIASAAPLAWLHTNQACRDYGEALIFATEWEKRGLAFVQLGESDFRSLKSKHEETLRELAALRARDDGRVKRAQESVSKFLLEYGFIQLSADVVWCAVMAHDVLTAADGVKQ